MTEGISKRQVLLTTGLNAKHFDQLVDAGVLEFLPNPSNPLRRKVRVSSLGNMQEGAHFVTCLECESLQSQITTKHLRACAGVDLDLYQTRHPNARLQSSIASENKAKTGEQRTHQSEVLLARFQTDAGEVTRQQISESSTALMQTDYREQASEHLRTLNSSPEQRAHLRELTTARWGEGGDLRERVPKWHAENKDLSNELAAKARTHLPQKETKLHLLLRTAMWDAGLDGFETELVVDYYAIDEGNPTLKIAVEADGCYWHSCPQCAFSGPAENQALDKRKNTYLRNRGWTVLRFWGHDIKERPNWCVAEIQKAIQEAQCQ